MLLGAAPCARRGSQLLRRAHHDTVGTVAFGDPAARRHFVAHQFIRRISMVRVRRPSNPRSPAPRFPCTLSRYRPSAQAKFDTGDAIRERNSSDAVRITRWRWKEAFL